MHWKTVMHFFFLIHEGNDMDGNSSKIVKQLKNKQPWVWLTKP